MTKESHTFFSNQQKRMSTSALVVMLGLMISKVTGHVREILVVPTLGYGVNSDAYFLGFQIPDLFYQLLIGGAIAAAITPIMSAGIEQKNEKRVWRSISIFLNVMIVTIIIAIIIGEIMAPRLIHLNNSKLRSEEVVKLATSVSRALFPQVFFMMLAAFSIGILNAYKKFTASAIGPVIYNCFCILVMIIFGKKTPQGAIHVAIGIAFAAAVFFIFQMYLAKNEFRNYQLIVDFKDQGFQKIVKLMIPTLISGSIIQINSIVLMRYTDQFVGAATSLRNATTTWQLPYGIFCVAIGNVILPSLSRHYAAKRHDEFRNLYMKGLRIVLFLIMPFALLFFYFRYDVIQGIFQWSKDYSNSTVEVTAKVLIFFCIALVAQSFIFITNQAFYARHNTKVALFNGLLTLTLNSIFCYILIRLVKVDIIGLSFSYALTSCISAIILYKYFKFKFKELRIGRLLPFMFRVVCCLLMMQIAVSSFNLFPVQPEHKIGQLLWLGARFGFALIVYYIAALSIRLREARRIQDKIRQILRLKPLRKR